MEFYFMSILSGILTIIAGIILSGFLFITLSFFISSLWERERRAAIFAFSQCLISACVLSFFYYLLSSGFFKELLGIFILAVFIIAILIGILLISIKTSKNQKALLGTKGYISGSVERFDERDHVFARNRALRPGSKQYKQYYEEHPERELIDKKRREMGGPIGPPGKIDSPNEHPNIAATMSSLAVPLIFSHPDIFNPKQHPIFGGKKVKLTPEEATERVKGFTKHLGASLVGVTEIDPNWIYSHRGEIFRENWEDWGKEIKLAHRYAVVFAVEMAFKMVASAPHTPTVIESMRNYAKGAFIAIQLAAYITNMGYPSTAHHLRHYDVMLVPLAIDAGLGELGRMGYLITKEFGPRVRLGAVTTTLPLIPDKPVDIGVEDFCKICKKCAVCCPSKSIPSEEQKEVVNGTLRWKLNAETCFDYWGKIGTDCNICMNVCPWSHPRTFPHKIIMGLVTRNSHARHLFSFLDDLFYGKKPKAKLPPRWASFNSNNPKQP